MIFILVIGVALIVGGVFVIYKTPRPFAGIAMLGIGVILFGIYIGVSFDPEPKHNRQDVYHAS